MIEFLDEQSEFTPYQYDYLLKKQTEIGHRIRSELPHPLEQWRRIDERFEPLHELMQKIIQEEIDKQIEYELSEMILERLNKV